MNLIYDSDEIKRFLNKVLVPLEDDEVFLLLLNTRKKYCPGELSRSEEVLGREIIRDNDIDKIIRKIRKISCTDDMYVDRNTLRPVSANCMALYMLLDPRSGLKGYSEFVSDINKWVYESLRGESKNLELYRRIDIKLFSAIHKNRSRSLYWIIDIDRKSDEMLDMVIELLDDHIVWISETHGGYHVIVDRNRDSGEIIYENLRDIAYIEILKEPMTPIPGTLQGGFKVQRSPRPSGRGSI